MENDGGCAVHLMNARVLHLALRNCELHVHTERLIGANIEYSMFIKFGLKEGEKRMKTFNKIATVAGVVVCAMAINHEMGQVKAATKWIPFSTQSAAQLAALGKKISQQKGCNSCHGADYKGKPNFSPSLRATGVMRKYNTKTFARLMAVGLTEDGEKVKKPMPVYRMKAADSNALYAFLKTLK